MIRRVAKLVIALLSLTVCLRPALADDKIVIGTDWRAEAAHGGIYQALATGIYARYHLDVTIAQGGPQQNPPQLLVAGRYNFIVVSNSFEELNFVANGVPVVVVAAAFQKDPQVLIAHRGAGNDTLAEMRGKPVMISPDSRDDFWQFLRQRYGFTDDQIRPYTYDLQPFLVNRDAIVQGYLTDEPFAIQAASGENPVTILLADQGYASYAAGIGTTQAMIDARPDLVRRFVAATMAGWKSYLEGDPGPANKLIEADNPEMTETLLAHARAAIIAHGLVESGDAKVLGIGAMTDRRWQDFATFAIKAGLYPASLDVHKAYRLDFLPQAH